MSSRSVSVTVLRIAAAWPKLAPHIRESVLTLIDASQEGGAK